MEACRAGWVDRAAVPGDETADGPLAGLAFVVKDSLDVSGAGLRCLPTWCSGQYVLLAKACSGLDWPAHTAQDRARRTRTKP